MAYFGARFSRVSFYSVCFFIKRRSVINFNILLIIFGCPSPSQAEKVTFSIKDFFSNFDQIRKFPADLVTFTEKILNGKLQFLFSEWLMRRALETAIAIKYSQES